MLGIQFLEREGGEVVGAFPFEKYHVAPYGLELRNLFQVRGLCPKP